MHEISIAMRLVEAATDAVRAAGEDRPIEAVRIQVGALSGVVVQALEFSWDVASEGTPCEGATLEIESITARVHCEACDADTELASPNRFRCGLCDGPSGTVVACRELDLVALELTDDPPDPRESDPSPPLEASHSAHP